MVFLWCESFPVLFVLWFWSFVQLLSLSFVLFYFTLRLSISVALSLVAHLLFLFSLSLFNILLYPTIRLYSCSSTKLHMFPLRICVIHPPTRIHLDIFVPTHTYHPDSTQSCRSTLEYAWFTRVRTFDVSLQLGSTHSFIPSSLIDLITHSLSPSSQKTQSNLASRSYNNDST